MQFHDGESATDVKINIVEIIGNADKGGMENFIKDFDCCSSSSLVKRPNENFLYK